MDVVSRKLERTKVQSSKVCTVVSAAYTSGKVSFNALEKLVLPSRKPFYVREGLAYLSKSILNHILHPSQQSGFTVEETRCWAGLPAVQTFHQYKTFGESWNYKCGREDPALLSSQHPTADKNGTTSLTQNSSECSSHLLEFDRLQVKRRDNATKW